MSKKKSFFERLTGGVSLDEANNEENELEDLRSGSTPDLRLKRLNINKEKDWIEEESEEGQLMVDVYQTPTDIIIQTMVAGVKLDDLSVNITRDMVTIKGRRGENRTIDEENYFVQELYWGSFTRTILLPQEIEPEEAEAAEKHGLLTIKLPKIDKDKKTSLKIKSL